DSGAARSGDVIGRYTGAGCLSLEKCTTTVDTWLRLCTAKHDKCSVTLSGCGQIDPRNSPLPTRCVRVDKSPDGLSFCLYDTQPNLRDAYITLSHRWTDETQKTMTTSANLSDRLRGKAFENLPRIFTDAFAVAASQDIRYVWIDSLCIVQGKDGEFVTEALKMADYYQNSTFTIACPAAALGTDIGLFNLNNMDHPSHGIQLIRLPYHNKTQEQDGFFYLYQANLNFDETFRQQVCNTEMMTRGWIFQEWILSRRIACFTPSGLFLQCQEKGPRNHLEEYVHNWSEGFVFAHFAVRYLIMTANITKGTYAQLHRSWEGMVETYSALSLTNVEKDRLVAMSGIANEFGRAFQAREAEVARTSRSSQDLASSEAARTYLAGIWRRELTRGLLWEIVKGGIHERLDHIPTWSWASICTQVKWADNVRDEDWKRFRDRIADDCRIVNVLNPRYNEGTKTFEDVDQQTFVNGPPELIPQDKGHNESAAENPRSRFPILCLRAKLQPIVIGGVFCSQDDKELAISLASRSPIFGVDNWRTVASPLNKKYIAGWASLEHADFQAIPEEDDDGLEALHVSTVQGIKGGIQLGYLSATHHVYNVLIVRSVGKVVRGYERVGVGRLFGRDFDQGFQQAEEMEIRLV
ncbi:heterokaryon incompatibility protein-domain-containing protein, partial [Rhypophila decipiens]